MTFISMDTYDLANKYAYCNNDPIDATDPNGHMALPIQICLGFLTFVSGGLSALALNYGIPRDVQQKVNIAITAFLLVLSVITAGKTLGMAISKAGATLGTALGQTAVRLTLAAVVIQGANLANSCVTYNQYAQQAVGFALMIAGLGLMAKGMMSAKSMQGEAQIVDQGGGGPDDNNNGGIIRQENMDDNDAIEKFKKDLADGMNFVQSTVIFSKSGIMPMWADNITSERLQGYIDNEHPVFAYKNYLDFLLKGESISSAIIKSRYGDCLEQAFLIAQTMKEKGYFNIDIHFRKLPNGYAHIFASIKFNGIRYIMDPWAGKYGELKDFPEYSNWIKNRSLLATKNEWLGRLGMPSVEDKEENSLLL